jgi:uncharacterized protein with FMN-binding domain
MRRTPTARVVGMKMVMAVSVVVMMSTMHPRSEEQPEQAPRRRRFRTQRPQGGADGEAYEQSATHGHSGSLRLNQLWSAGLGS